MERIIAGRFPTLGQADAASALMAPYIAATDICIFHNNPPGQHDPLVTDSEDEDGGVENAPTASAGTAIAAGLAAGAVGSIGGPIVAIVAAGVGAYTGAFAGALAGMGDDEADVTSRAPDHRAGGVMLSVRISEPVNELRVIETLRAQGAADIEHAQGEWSDGDWTDFDPAATPRLVPTASF